MGLVQRRLKLAAAVVVSILGLTAFVFGIAAFRNRIQRPNFWVRRETGTCGYFGTSSHGLATTAAVLILATQIVGTAFGGRFFCFCRRNNPMSAKYKGAIVCFVLSWILTVLAFVLLLIGSALNSSTSFDNPQADKCGTIPPGWPLSTGAVVALLSTILLTLFLLLALSPWPSSTTMAGTSQMPHSAPVSSTMPANINPWHGAV